MSKKKVYARLARFYDFLDSPFEAERYVPLRREMWQGLSGRILDAGVGTGRNMPFYPQGEDDEVTGIDLSPHMLEQAEMRKTEVGARVDLSEMNVLSTDFPDDHFDYVVATFLFCVLDDEDQMPALQELRRITKPNGEIRILEYDISKNFKRRFVQKLWAPWVSFMYGARFDRNTEQYVEAANLKLTTSRFLYEDMIKILVMKPIV